MTRFSLCIAALIAALLQLQVLAADGSMPTLILRGYDAVAYFTDGKPVKGEERYSYDWDEGRYYFASAEHRDRFAADPARYAPQFGGYCTGSMSRGVKNEGHPEAWVVVDGKLHVFGAPDSETARKYKEAAERDLDAFRAKAGLARANWAAR